jgi:hypothetical protein
MAYLELVAVSCLELMAYSLELVAYCMALVEFNPLAQ